MQPTQLYLDTARLGRMSKRAQQAQIDFTRLAGQEGASLFFERFLREGTAEWPETVRSQFPGLACWQGTDGLQRSLRQLAGSDPALPVLMANRLSCLMQFASRLLFHPCRNVLVTDLGWPPYREILNQEARRAGRLVTEAAVRHLVFTADMTEEALIDSVRRRFIAENCDGLFVTAVSHDGVRLPVEQMVRALEAVRELRFVVIDGAQDFCHVSADLNNAYCDLYLAGCHKWLQGYQPMGLGFYGRRSSVGVIETLLEYLLANGELDDPLLRFSRQLEAGSLRGDTETVNLVPLLTSQGAASEVIENRIGTAQLDQRRSNVQAVLPVATEAEWSPLLPASPFQTGVALLKSTRDAIRRLPSVNLRETFAKQGVALTAYTDGVVRLAMPAVSLQQCEIGRLHSALRAVA